MSGTAARQKLLTWFSSSFPVGAFAWSAGLETAIIEGRTSDPASVGDWIKGTLAGGALRTDAILLAHAHAAASQAGRLQELADLALALTASAERRLEMLDMGGAFVRAAQTGWASDIYRRLPPACPYAVAAGAIAAAHNAELSDTLMCFLTAAVQAQISVGVRLVPLGQTEGLRIMAGVEPAIAALARLAPALNLEDMGGSSYAADIAQMRHETLTTRIFRS